jgi:hypothetical protein
MEQQHPYGTLDRRAMLCCQFEVKVSPMAALCARHLPSSMKRTGICPNVHLAFSSLQCPAFHSSIVTRLSCRVPGTSHNWCVNYYLGLTTWLRQPLCSHGTVASLFTSMGVPSQSQQQQQAVATAVMHGSVWAGVFTSIPSFPRTFSRRATSPRGTGTS